MSRFVAGRRKAFRIDTMPAVPLVEQLLRLVLEANLATVEAVDQETDLAPREAHEEVTGEVHPFERESEPPPHFENHDARG